MFKKMAILLLVAALCIPTWGVSAQTEYTGSVELYQEGKFPNVPTVSLYATDAQKQAAYNAILAAAEAFEDNVILSTYSLTSVDLNLLYTSVINNNPQLFYLTSLYSFTVSGSTVAKLIFQYAYEKSLINAKKLLVQQEVNRILAIIDTSMTDVQKALAVHDYFALHYAYDTDNALSTTPEKKTFTIAGLFIDKTAVCQGYALGYKYILNLLGIEAEYVPSSSMNHGWNMIKIDGQWYHVDVTWDDPTRNNYDIIGIAQHRFFLLSDATMGDANHGHSGWSAAHTATSTAYETAFWTTLDGGIIWENGNWYYASKNSSRNTIVRRSPATLAGAETVLYTLKNPWKVWGGSGAWNGIFTDIVAYDNRIFFTERDKICSVDFSGKNLSTVYTPDTSTGYIYGFTEQYGNFVYGLAESPNDVLDVHKYICDPTVAISAEKHGSSLIVSVLSNAAARTGGKIFVGIYRDATTSELLRLLPMQTMDAETMQYTFALPEGVSGVAQAVIWENLKPVCKPTTVAI